MPEKARLVAGAVSKRFRKGLNHDSLRDLVPMLAKRLLGRSRPLPDGAFWALRDVSFEVAPGEALGIIGPNGAGKSTLLKILSGILRPDAGNIRVSGRLSSLIEVGAGFHLDLTGRENVYLNGAILGMAKREVDRKFDAIVEFAGLVDFIDTPIKRYSSGMQARLGYSVAAHMDPDVLLVDEVLSVGDYHFQTRCLDQMRRFIRNGVTVVFVSHNMNAVGSLCTRCLLLEGGRVKYLGEPAVAIQQYYRQPSDADPAVNDPIRIRAVRLEDASGREAAAFRNGDRAVLRAWIASTVGAKTSVGLVVRNQDELVISDTATTRLLGQTLQMEPGRECEVAFEFSIRFCSGSYRLSVNVEDPLTHRYYTYARNVASLAVVDGETCGGICFIEPNITVREDGLCLGTEPATEQRMAAFV